MDLNIPVQNDAAAPVDSGAYVDDVNDLLYVALFGEVLTPQAGIQKIRNIMLDHGIDIPMIFELDPAGSQMTFVISDDLYLYIAYALDTSGFYEFFAAIVDQEELEDLNLNYEDDEDGFDTE